MVCGFREILTRNKVDNPCEKGLILVTHSLSIYPSQTSQFVQVHEIKKKIREEGRQKKFCVDLLLQASCSTYDLIRETAFSAS